MARVARLNVLPPALVLVADAMPTGIACLAMHPALYLFSRAYRELAEVAAYRAQMRYPDGKGGRLSLDGAAARLAGPRYALGITIDRARELLSD